MPPEVPSAASLPTPAPVPPRASNGQAMRAGLQAFMAQAAQGRLPIAGLAASPSGMARADGHFHLGAELFLQLGGQTHFRMPHAEVQLQPQQALVMPPRTLHHETVQDGAQAFANIVIYADSQLLSCHLAFQESPGRPGILHLEQCRDSEAARIQGWLADAALPPPQDGAGTWELQQRALVLTVLAAVRRLLDAPGSAERAGPPLLAKLGVLLQNRLGEPELTVAGLAHSLGCSADYLSHLYGKHHGEHLRAAIQRLRLARAARLLEEGELAVKEVAWSCGFGSASYFIRSFQQAYGCTPKSYQMRHSSAAGQPQAASAPLGAANYTQ